VTQRGLDGEKLRGACKDAPRETSLSSTDSSS
jgi:hypothetical protein